MQRVNCFLKILFNYDELTPRAEKIKTLHTIETKWGIKICYQTRTFTLCSHVEKIRESMFKIHVQCSNQCSKYFKIFVVSSIQINKAAIKLYPRDLSFSVPRYLENQEQ